MEWKVIVRMVKINLLLTYFKINKKKNTTLEITCVTLSLELIHFGIHAFVLCV